jgi:hypothetical protein
LYIASPKEIKLVTLVDDVDEGETLKVSPDDSEVATIRPDEHKIHGLFINEFGLD